MKSWHAAVNDLSPFSMPILLFCATTRLTLWTGLCTLLSGLLYGFQQKLQLLAGALLG